MSRINKVNPGKYTQAGRLTPDDAARERKKQRETPSPKHTEGGEVGPPSQPASKAAAARQATAEDKKK